MGKIETQIYRAKRGWKSHLKSSNRKERFRLEKAGYQLHQLNMKRLAIAEGRKYKPTQKSPFLHEKILPPKPEYPSIIKYLKTFPDLFSESNPSRKSGHIYIPNCFSLIDEYDESYNFLKQIFVILDRNHLDEIILDYKNCERIDVDASLCMDIILANFIQYFYRCRNIGLNDAFKKGIIPINFGKENIKKVLFSIGAYSNLKGFKIKYNDIEALPVIISNHNHPHVWSKSEVDLTRIVEYIKQCLTRLNRELTADSENEFYKVIGEVMSNALEHGTMQQSFAIGFFQETHNDSEHFGVFNFSIINFGDTIYQTFKKEGCLNKKAVTQMENLSKEYTKNGWFKKSTFEEETLWTLYALQQGVTSKEKKRGNGSIEYIENFFKLKGDNEKDDFSKLVLVSGNTRIIFDGTYDIIKKKKVGTNKIYKMITFNESGEISDAPDNKFVTFVPHFFPGTMISARILIKFDNTKEQLYGIESL